MRVLLVSTEARVRVEPDETMFDDSYIDTWGLDDDEAQAERDELWRTIEREGVWGFIAEWRPFPGAAWRHVESCWGFVGDPPAEELQAALEAAQREARMLPCGRLDPHCV